MIKYYCDICGKECKQVRLEKFKLPIKEEYKIEDLNGNILHQGWGVIKQEHCFLCQDCQRKLADAIDLLSKQLDKKG